MEPKSVRNIFGDIPIAGESGVSAERPKTEPAPGPRRSTASPIHRKKKPVLYTRLLTWLALITIGSICFYLALGYLLVPVLFQSWLPASLGDKLDRHVTIGRAEFDPLSLQVTLHNGIIGPKRSEANDPVDPLLSFGRAAFDLELYSLITGGVICRQVDIDTFFFHLVRESTSTYNIGAFPVNTRPGQAGLLPFPGRYSLNNLSFSNSRFVFDDRPAAKTHTLEEISLTLPTLANFIYRADRYLNPEFSAQINGSPVHVSGKTSVTPDSLAALLDFRLTAIDLPTYLAYLPMHFNFTVSQGKADLDLHLIFNMDPGKSLELQIEGGGELTDVLLLGPEGRLTKIPKTKIEGSFAPLSGRYHLRDLILSQPEMDLEKLADGRWSSVFAGLHFPGRENRAAEASPSFQIDRLQVTGGTLNCVDHQVQGGYADTWSDIVLSLENWGSASAKQALFAITAKNRAKAGISGQGTIASDSGKIEGVLVADQLALPALSPYLPPEYASLLLRGVLLRLESNFAYSPGNSSQERESLLLRQGTLLFGEVNLVDKGFDLLRSRQLSLRFSSLDLTAKTFEIEQVEAKEASIFLRRDAQGIFNWPAIQTAAAMGTEAKGWEIVVQSLDLDQATVSYEDSRFTVPLALKFYPVHIQLANLSNRQAEAGAFNLTGDLSANEGLLPGVSPVPGSSGQIRLSGAVSLSPFHADLQCQIERLRLALFQPLLKEWFRPEVVAGVLQATGKLQEPESSFTGLVTISDFAATEQKQSVVSWQEAAAREVVFSAKPLVFETGDINCEQPVVTWSVPEQGPSNLVGLFYAAKERWGNDSRLKLGNITIHDGSLAFHDQSLNPAYQAGITAISGSIKNLANSQGNRAEVQLDGIFQENSEIGVSGSVGFFDQNFYSDVKIKGTNLEMAPLSPYLAPHLGYETQNGALDLEVSYHVENLKVDAGNNLRLVGLKLGRKLKKGNTSLKRAMALLMDENGLIQFDLPVNGVTTDASFSYRDSLGKIFRKLLLKATVSPFSLVSSFFPEQSSPEHIVFPLGVAELPAEDHEQLEILAGILKHRPGLTLRIKGFADAGEDRQEMLNKLRLAATQQGLEDAARLSRELSSAYGSEEIKTTGGVSPADTNLSGNQAKAQKEIKITDERLADLARRRAQEVKKLLEAMGIAPVRLIAVGTGILVPANSPGRSGNRTDLLLEAGE